MKRAERRYNRYVKMMRRLKGDRQTHDNFDCACFLNGDKRTNGKVKARFADTPKLCSKPWCCGNPRHLLKKKDALTIQERRAFERT